MGEVLSRRLILLILFFMFSPSHADDAVETSAPSCPAKTPLPTNLQPEMIANYIRVNRLKSVEDLSCCLAKIPGLEIAIAHNSLAAQNGTYLEPRVIMVKRGAVDPVGGERSIEAAFSINSGGPHMSQGHSVEMMFNDPAHQALVYSDIDFSKSPPMGHPPKRNPPQCMTCHGEGGGKVAPWGPRPILEITPWPSFVLPTASNSRDFLGPNFCPQRVFLDPLIARATKEAMDTNPRYACVKNLPMISVDEFDKGLTMANDRRSSRFLTATKDYGKFKYALAGTVCPDFDPADYIPGPVLNTMTDVSMVMTNLRNASTQEELVNFHDAARISWRQHADVRDEQKAALKEIIKARKPLSLADEVEDSHFCSLGSRPLNLLKPSSGSTADLFIGNNMVFHRYQADSSARALGSRVLSGKVRFLFESRGIDLSGFGMSPQSGTYHRTFDVIGHFKRTEPSGTKLRQILDVRDEGLRCNRLKQASMEAFGVTPVKDNPSSPPAVTR